MRVGYIAYALDRPLTGIGRYSAELGRGLSACKGEVDLVYLSAGSASYLAAQGARRVELKGCALLPMLMTLGNLLIPALARKLRLDVVHDPTGATPLALPAGRAKRVTTIHDVIPFSYPGVSTALDTLIYRVWLPHIIPLIVGVITDSEASRVDIQRYLGVPAHKITVIPLYAGAEFRPQSPAAIHRVRRQYGLPDRYVLYVGAWAGRKNVPLLIEAFAEVTRRAPNVRLVLAGPSSGQAELRSRIDTLGIGDRVHFLGYVAREDLPPLYAGAELFAFPSRYEGFGLPVLEAMACGAPVVTSNVSSLPEVAGDAGLLIDPSDSDALASAMSNLLCDRSLRDELIRRGLCRARRFSRAATARATLEFYRRVCGDSPRPGRVG